MSSRRSADESTAQIMRELHRQADSFGRQQDAAAARTRQTASDECVTMSTSTMHMSVSRGGGDGPTGQRASLSGASGGSTRLRPLTRLGGDQPRQTESQFDLWVDSDASDDPVGYDAGDEASYEDSPAPASRQSLSLPPPSTSGLLGAPPAASSSDVARAPAPLNPLFYSYPQQVRHSPASAYYQPPNPSPNATAESIASAFTSLNHRLGGIEKQIDSIGEQTGGVEESVKECLDYILDVRDAQSSAIDAFRSRLGRLELLVGENIRTTRLDESDSAHHRAHSTGSIRQAKAAWRKSDSNNVVDKHSAVARTNEAGGVGVGGGEREGGEKQNVAGEKENAAGEKSAVGVSAGEGAAAGGGNDPNPAGKKKAHEGPNTGGTSSTTEGMIPAFAAQVGVGGGVGAGSRTRTGDGAHSDAKAELNAGPTLDAMIKDVTNKVGLIDIGLTDAAGPSSTPGVDGMEVPASATREDVGLPRPVADEEDLIPRAVNDEEEEGEGNKVRGATQNEHAASQPVKQRKPNPASAALRFFE